METSNFINEEGVFMAFKTRKKEDFSYFSPQEMYQDNKFKKIMGPLDYQAAMLNLYIENADKKTVALELPIGSGKTLVGLAGSKKSYAYFLIIKSRDHVKVVTWHHTWKCVRICGRRQE